MERHEGDIDAGLDERPRERRIAEAHGIRLQLDLAAAPPLAQTHPIDEPRIERRLATGEREHPTLRGNPGNRSLDGLASGRQVRRHEAEAARLIAVEIHPHEVLALRRSILQAAYVPRHELAFDLLRHGRDDRQPPPGPVVFDGADGHGRIAVQGRSGHAGTAVLHHAAGALLQVPVVGMHRPTLSEREQVRDTQWPSEQTRGNERSRRETHAQIELAGGRF